MKRYSGFSVRLVVVTCLLAGGRILWGAEALPEDRMAGDLRRAWELLEAGDAEATVEFADNTLSGISKEALAEAGKMGGFSPKGEEYNYNQVNVAGTLAYVKALA